MNSKEELIDLRRRLNDLEKLARGRIVRVERRGSMLRAAPLALWTCAAVPVIWVLSVGVGALLGIEVPRPSPIAFAGLVAAPAFVGLLIGWLGGAPEDVARGRALSVVDDAHGLSDRLRAAADFMERDEPTPFMWAAIADARRVIEERELALKSWIEPPTAVKGLVAPILAVAALVILATLISFVAGDDVPAGNRSDDAPLVATATEDRPEQLPSTTEVPTAEEAKPAATRRDEAEMGGSRSRMADTSDAIKESRGQTSRGRSAEAASASGASASKGSATDQGLSGKGSKKTAKKRKKAKKRTEKKPEVEARKKKLENRSGSTAGKGAATGSNKSPDSSRWSSRDQVVSEDEDDLEDDEEVDDESDESDSRGGTQPSLRDRKPPVNRDLGIGFGNRPDPDANVRGGPSAQKKSRGVAALVLGVPIPDHVKGKPNPGKTKITQERIEPSAEDGPVVSAESRRPRQDRIEPLTRRQLSPWMKAMVRTFYKSMRSPERRPAP